MEVLTMNNFRKVNDDILKDWLMFREEEISSLSCDDDKKHWIYFDEIAENILRNVPEQNKKYVKKQLEQLDENFMDYIFYWNEKYYRNGFVKCSTIVFLLLLLFIIFVIICNISNFVIHCKKMVCYFIKNQGLRFINNININ